MARGPHFSCLGRRGIQRAADVIAAVDQDAGNAVQCRGITEQLLLREEGGVPPVVRDQAREPEAKFRIFVARIREMAGGEGDVSDIAAFCSGDCYRAIPRLVIGQLLKQLAPGVTRAAVLRDPTVTSGIGQFGAIQGAAASRWFQPSRQEGPARIEPFA
jgi:hypothetical protein